MDFVVLDGMATMQMAVMTKRLKDAEPTIVDAPSSPGLPPRVDIVS